MVAQPSALQLEPSMSAVQPKLVIDFMTTRPALIRDDSNILAAAEVVSHTQVSDLMVVDSADSFVGVLSEGDILRKALPDIGTILDEGGSLNDAFDIFVSKGQALSDLPIRSLIIDEPLTIGPQDHIGRAAAVLVDRQIRLLPVVEHGKLLGTLSRADICRALVGSL